MGDIILQGNNLSKAFYSNNVLRGVSISCKTGTVLALVGENGAGKSTLMNIISGGLQPDTGEILLDGKPVRFKSAHHARQRGVAFVHQELSLLGDLTVGENIMLGLEPAGKGLLKSKQLHQQAAAVLEELEYKVNPYSLVAQLTPAERQITEIAKAWATKPRILILDEPTSSLNKRESDTLFRFVARAREAGVSVILITHRMEEIFTACDEAIVLRDGEMTATEPVANLTKDDLIRKMVGREVKNTFPARCETISDEAVLELRGAEVAAAVQGVDLRVPKGCVVGIGGLEGQGQRELARALFGIEPFTAGSYHLYGRQVQIKNPAAAIRHGLGFVPDDRKTEGLALPLSVEENMALLVLRQLKSGPFVSAKKTGGMVGQSVKALNIRLASEKAPVVSLSGGNQQKVVFSKWITAAPKVLVLHEPTRGVDVQSKLEIYELIRGLTADGVSVVLFSSDMLELIGMSDIIHVMYEGKIAGSLPGKEATEEKLMTLSSGLALAEGRDA